MIQQIFLSIFYGAFVDPTIPLGVEGTKLYRICEGHEPVMNWQSQRIVNN